MSPFWSGALGALALLLVLKAVRIAFWRRRFRRGGPRGAWMLRRLSARLRLEPEQERLFRAEADALAAELAGLRGDAHAAKKELASLLAGPALDPAAASELLARPLAKLEAARARAAEALARVHAALRPEQRAELAALVRQAGPRRFRHGHA